MLSRKERALLAGAALLLLSPGARADVSFLGNARAIAMGGAGLAVVDRSGRTTPDNPAALALLNRRVKLAFPSIGVSASGVPLDRAFSRLTSNPDRRDAVSLARDFGRRNSDFGAFADWSIRFGHMDLEAYGVGRVRLLPNNALQSWAQTAGGDVTKLTGSERADLLGAAIYSLPTIGIAERISPAGSPTRTEIGARIKFMHAIYTHYLVNSDNLRNNTAGASAPELNGGSSITKDGFGLDVGFLVHPRDHSGLSGALVVTNLVEPSFVFYGTDTAGAQAKYDLQPRSLSMGTAWEGGKSLFAFDLIDLTRAYGNPQARFGVEYRTRRWAVRAGYASARGFTAGLGYGWFDIAVGARAPLEITQTLRF